jgi:predicted transcriptional regulator
MATSPPKEDPQRTSTHTQEWCLSTRSAEGVPERLRLLEDDHSREILTTLADGPRHARALADLCGVSRATVYRRLDRLESAGFITTELSPDPDGHHRREFHLLRDRVTVTLTGGTVAVTASPSDRDESERHTTDGRD